MTENESLLEYCERAVKNCVEECGGACSLRIKECECVDANVLKHLRELEQYRAIGTVEDIQMIFQLCKDLQVMCGEYKEIGTIEEFKALKEKGNPKRVDEEDCCPICHTYGKDDN